jgi:hypothetical protein
MDVKPGTEKLAFISPFEDTRKSRLSIDTLRESSSHSELDSEAKEERRSRGGVTDLRKGEGAL